MNEFEPNLLHLEILKKAVEIIANRKGSDKTAHALVDIYEPHHEKTCICKNKAAEQHLCFWLHS